MIDCYKITKYFRSYKHFNILNVRLKMGINDMNMQLLHLILYLWFYVFHKALIIKLIF